MANFIMCVSFLVMVKYCHIFTTIEKVLRKIQNFKGVAAEQ